ncbi:MAG: isoprenylcysteine carboxylmethyltransferase family protein [Tetrasphaera sp.]
MADRGAPVKVLPPLLYAVPFALAWLAEWRWPTSLGLGASGRVAGGLLVLSGMALMLWAFWEFRRRGTTILPWGAATSLATTGPYRLTRNPIYLGDALAYLGASLLLDSIWPLPLLPLIMVANYRWVIRHEEAYLATRFGRAYAEYRLRVRRWL